MSKETRHNLIFIVILLAAVVPGAIKLFKMKLDPTARKMYMPDAVDHRIAYMDQQPVPDDFKRFVPDKVAEWIKRQSPARGITSPTASLMPLGDDGLPVMSENRIFQVAAIETTPTGARVGLIAWSGDVGGATSIISWGQVFPASATTVPTTGSSDVSYTIPGDRAPGRVEVEEMAIPDDVRKELAKGGLFKPPQRVRWILVEYSDVPPGSRLKMTARFTDINSVIGDSAEVMVPPFAPGLPGGTP